MLTIGFMMENGRWFWSGNSPAGHDPLRNWARTRRFSTWRLPTTRKGERKQKDETKEIARNHDSNNNNNDTRTATIESAATDNVVRNNTTVPTTIHKPRFSLLYAESRLLRSLLQPKVPIEREREISLPWLQQQHGFKGISFPTKDSFK